MNRWFLAAGFCLLLVPVCAFGQGVGVSAEAEVQDNPIPMEVLVLADTSRAKASARALLAADLAADDGTRPPRGFVWPFAGAFLPNDDIQDTGTPSRRESKLSAREARTRTLGSALIWVPRVLLFPLYLGTEYLVRWPLGVITKATEKYHVLDYVSEYTTWDGDNGRVLPTFRIASGFAPAVGLGAVWENMFVDQNDWALAFDFNAGDNFTVDALTRLRLLDDDFSSTFGYRAEFRNDFVFNGIGPDAEDVDETRFSRRKQMLYLRNQLDPRDGGFGLKGTIELSSFGFGCAESREEDICGSDGRLGGDDPLDIDLESIYFTEGYDVFRLKGSVFYDSRPERPKRGSGVRMEASGRFGTGVGNDNSQVQFYRAGGELSLFLDVLHQRVLMFQVYGEIAEPLNGQDIPFSELIIMGGVERMRGFNLGRFHGRSAVVGTLGYRYPVWSFLDGFVVVEAGNVFDPRFEALELGNLHGSAAIGLSTNTNRYQSFDMLLAVGTGKFQGGFEVDSVRVAIGTKWGP